MNDSAKPYIASPATFPISTTVQALGGMRERSLRSRSHSQRRRDFDADMDGGLGLKTWQADAEQEPTFQEPTFQEPTFQEPTVLLRDLLPTEFGYHYAPIDFHVPTGFKLSIVIPVYNEADTILQLLARVASMPLDKEIVIVDDCSTDNTMSQLESIAAATDVRIIGKDKNCGKGAALRTGFEAASGNFVVVQDADLEYDPRDIPGVIEPLVNGIADVVYGSRYLKPRKHDHWFHRFGNWLLTTASNLTTGLRLTDMETCYKAFQPSVLASFQIEQSRFGVEPEITAKIARRGFRVLERPVGYDARGYDEGKKIGIRDGFNALYCILRYGFRD